MSAEPNAPRGGFSLVEMTVAMLVLTAGLLAMASASGYVTTQIQVADLRTERMAAVQSAVEELRATPFADIDDRAQNEALAVGAFQIWWEVERPAINLAQLTIHSSGPGFVSGQGWAAAVTQTVEVSLSR